MSVHRAGSFYGVPHSTLEYKVKERHLNKGKKRSTGTIPTNHDSSIVISDRPSLVMNTSIANLKHPHFLKSEQEDVFSSNPVTLSTTAKPVDIPNYKPCIIPTSLGSHLWNPASSPVLGNFPTTPYMGEAFYASQMMMRLQQAAAATRYAGGGYSETNSPPLDRQTSPLEDRFSESSFLYHKDYKSSSLDVLLARRPVEPPQVEHISNNFMNIGKHLSVANTENDCNENYETESKKINPDLSHSRNSYEPHNDALSFQKSNPFRNEGNGNVSEEDREPSPAERYDRLKSNTSRYDGGNSPGEPTRYNGTSPNHATIFDGSNHSNIHPVIPERSPHQNFKRESELCS